MAVVKRKELVKMRRERVSPKAPRAGDERTCWRERTGDMRLRNQKKTKKRRIGKINEIRGDHGTLTDKGPGNQGGFLEKK